MMRLDDRRVLAILQEGYKLSTREIARESALTFDQARKVAKRLVKKGLATSEVKREFERPFTLPGQGALFGGSVMCVRRRAYYAAIKR